MRILVPDQDDALLKIKKLYKYVFAIFKGTVHAVRLDLHESGIRV
jgi:hypothetical protein